MLIYMKVWPSVYVNTIILCIHLMKCYMALQNDGYEDYVAEQKSLYL